MNTEVAASIAVREQYAAQLKRHEDFLDILVKNEDCRAKDEAAIVTMLAIAIKGEARPWVPA